MRNGLFKAGLAVAVLALAGCTSMPKEGYKFESKGEKIKLEIVAESLRVPVNSLYKIADRNPEDGFISRDEANKFSNAFYEVVTGKWPDEKALKVPYDEGLEN